MANTKPKTKKNSSKLISNIIKGIWIAFIAVLVFLPLFIFSVSINLFNLYGDQPSLRSLENPKEELSSELYSADNVLLGKYYRENRTPVSYEELYPNIINTLLALDYYRCDNKSGNNNRR